MNPSLVDIHPTAVLHSSARLGSGTTVEPYAVIEEDTIIGQRCRIGAHAVIKRYTRLGDDNLVFESAVLGGPPQDTKFAGNRSYLVVGDRNTFREMVTVNRATGEDGETRIGNDNLIMAAVHIAHDCDLGNNIVILTYVGLAGHVHVEDHVRISGAVAVQQFSRIGKYAMVGAFSGVRQNVLPFFLTEGTPARIKAVNTVGLKRAGFSSQDVSALKAAFHILCNRSVTLREKLHRLEEIDSEHVRYLATFIQRSRLGFCGPEKRRGESRHARPPS